MYWAFWILTATFCVQLDLNSYNGIMKESLGGHIHKTLKWRIKWAALLYRELSKVGVLNHFVSETGHFQIKSGA